MTDSPHTPAEHPNVHFGRVGVLLVNLGTPDSTDKAAIRRYLGQFLSDRRVIDTSPLIWQPILHGIILRTRPGKVAHAYESVWREDTDESPLRYFTRAQSEKLAGRLNGIPNLCVDWAMRYGQPDIPSRLQALKESGCDRILIVPLYPQYSATTTATVNDQVFDYLKKQRWQPAIRTLPPYHDHPAYIEALAISIEEYRHTSANPAEVILASYHGLPADYLDKGDPYFCHCSKTTRLLRERLGLDEQQLIMSFQSRVGPKQWLQPYTDETLIQLARERRRVVAFTPGFAADCLETLEEMGMQNRDLYQQNGGPQYDLLPCLNDSEPGLDMLETLVRQELAGWVG